MCTPCAVPAVMEYMDSAFSSGGMGAERGSWSSSTSTLRADVVVSIDAREKGSMGGTRKVLLWGCSEMGVRERVCGQAPPLLLQGVRGGPPDPGRWGHEPMVSVQRDRTNALAHTRGVRGEGGGLYLSCVERLYYWIGKMVDYEIVDASSR